MKVVNPNKLPPGACTVEAWANFEPWRFRVLGTRGSDLSLPDVEMRVAGAFGLSGLAGI
jgi:hypothetical protein